MSLVDYTYYTDIYNGFKVPSEQFNYYSERATEEIESIVTVIMTDEQKSLDEVKRCACEVTEKLYNLDNEKELSSERVGNYSRTFNTSRPQHSKERMIYTICEKHLGKLNLIYGGCTNVY